MSSPVILNEFSEQHPFSLTELNVVLRALAGAINAVAAMQVIQFNPAGGALDTTHVPASGGDFTGTISAPAILVGPAGHRFAVVTTDDTASPTVAGLVKQAAAVAALAQVPSDTYQKAELKATQDKLNELIAALHAAGMVA